MAIIVTPYCCRSLCLLFFPLMCVPTLFITSSFLWLFRFLLRFFFFSVFVRCLLASAELRINHSLAYQRESMKLKKKWHFLFSFTSFFHFECASYTISMGYLSRLELEHAWLTLLCVYTRCNGTLWYISCAYFSHFQANLAKSPKDPETVCYANVSIFLRLAAWIWLTVCSGHLAFICAVMRYFDIPSTSSQCKRRSGETENRPTSLKNNGCEATAIRTDSCWISPSGSRLQGFFQGRKKAINCRKIHENLDPGFFRE